VKAAPTYSQSWKLWCLALDCCALPEARVAERLAKQSEGERNRLIQRIDYIRKHKAIPVSELLP
jgi:hypothetical protein